MIRGPRSPHTAPVPPRRFGMATRTVPLLILAASCLAAFAAGCDDEPEVAVNATVRVETARFFPSNVIVPVGGKVRWVNVLPRETGTDRTVTGMEGPDGDAGWDLVDEVLRGYAQGRPEGDEFVYRFPVRGTFTYRSRLPEGGGFTGTIVVQ